MTERPGVTDELQALLSRIEAPPAVTTSVPAEFTGLLADLHRWWARLSPHADPRAATLAVETPPDADAALAAGAAAADRAIDAGATVLIPRVTDRDDLAARTVVALLTRREASLVVHQPTGMTDREWMLRCATVRDQAAAVVEHRGDPVALLRTLPAPGLALATGMLLAASARRTPCLLDGTDELAAALVADRLNYRAKGWWRAGSDSPDPARAAACNRIDLQPGLPLQLTDESGLGARATLALLALDPT